MEYSQHCYITRPIRFCPKICYVGGRMISAPTWRILYNFIFTEMRFAFSADNCSASLKRIYKVLENTLYWLASANRRAIKQAVTSLTAERPPGNGETGSFLRPRFGLRLGYVWDASSSSRRSVMFFRLMPRVEPLCSRAETVGGSMPATPRTIRDRLKPTMKR